MNQKQQNSTLVKASLSEQLIKILMDKMTLENYTPGSRIDIEELKREFGVSHIPIRDALHKLGEQGLVTIVPRVGYFTARFSREEVEDVFDVRTLLELSAIGKGIKAVDKKILASLKEEYTALREDSSGKSGDVRRFYELSEILHKDVIIKCARSPLIENIYTGLINKIRVSSRMAYLPNDDIDEHLELIRYLIDGDAAAAKKRLKAHLEAVKKRALRETFQSA